MGNNVRVVTFNAAGGNPRVTTPQEQFLELPFYCEALAGAPGAPILALQEVGAGQASALEAAAPTARARILQKRRPGLGNALVIPARYELLGATAGYFIGPHLLGTADGLWRRLRRRERPDWRQFGELRMFISARLRDTAAGRELTVLTTHLSVEASLKVPEARAIVARAERAGPPVILAGDMNVPAGHPRGRDVEAAAALARLRDMGTVAPPPPRENIDYVLALGFEPVSSRIRTDVTLRHGRTAQDVSDHYAEDDVLRYAP